MPDATPWSRVLFLRRRGSLLAVAECVTCSLVERRDAGEAPPWDRILRTEHWDVVHAYGTSLEGWLCLIVRRHVPAVAELTDAEVEELGPLLKRVSQALQDVTGCYKTYVVQLAEHRDHPHVHVHVIPRMRDLPDEHQGPRVFSLLGVREEEEVSEARRTEIAAAVAARLNAVR
jgi:diadenosine tetraphosphate (Ap4A) HIT family hydrolase